MSNKPIVAYDCMIFLQAAGRKSGPSIACMEMVDRDLVQLFISDDVLAEVKDVLTCPKVVSKFPNLTPDRVSEFLQRIEDKAIRLTPFPQEYSLLRDAKDELNINLALAANADFLVTRNKDLHELMDTSKEPGRILHEDFPVLEIVDPVEFLRILTRQRDAS